MEEEKIHSLTIRDVCLLIVLSNVLHVLSNVATQVMEVEVTVEAEIAEEEATVEVETAEVVIEDKKSCIKIGHHK